MIPSCSCLLRAILGKDGGRGPWLSHFTQGQSHPPRQTDLTFQPFLSQSSRSWWWESSECRLQGAHLGFSCHASYMGLVTQCLAPLQFPGKLSCLWSGCGPWRQSGSHHTYWWARIHWRLIQKSRGRLSQRPLLDWPPARSCLRCSKRHL